MRKWKLWRPGDPKARAIIKLTLWSGILTWAVLTLVLGVTYARKFGIVAPGLELVPDTSWGNFFVSWVIPIWIVFTTLMLVWAVVRFTVKYLRARPQSDEPVNVFNEEQLYEEDIKAIANNRALRKYKWRGLGVLLFVLILSGVVAWVSDVRDAEWAIYVFLGAAFIALVVFAKVIKNYERRFIDAWLKESQTLAERVMDARRQK